MHAGARQGLLLTRLGPDPTPGLWWCKRRQRAGALGDLPMPTTAKLTDTQLVILSQAAQRPDGRVLPTPPSLQAKGAAVKQSLKALLKRGLIREQPASKSDEEWRRDENEDPLTLVITPAGLAAIGLEDGDQVPEQPAPAEPTGAGQALTNPGEPPPASEHAGSARIARSERPEDAGRGGTKSDAITALLKRECGAALEELTAATGWQAHSVRGFLSGTLKKKLGYTVQSERGEDGVRRYRIAA